MIVDSTHSGPPENENFGLPDLERAQLKGLSKLATVDLQVSCGQMAIGHSYSSSDIGSNVSSLSVSIHQHIGGARSRGSKSVRRPCEDCAQMFYNMHKVEVERSLGNR